MSKNKSNASGTETPEQSHDGNRKVQPLVRQVNDVERHDVLDKFYLTEGFGRLTFDKFAPVGGLEEPGVQVVFDTAGMWNGEWWSLVNFREFVGQLNLVLDHVDSRMTNK